MTAPSFACVLVPRGKEILGVTRKTDHNDWGLPGGKLEEDEHGDPRTCAARELLEETGVKVDPDDLIEIFRANDGNGIAVTYLAATYEGEPTAQAGEGLTGWVSWETIESGTFGRYNRALHQAVMLRHGVETKR